MRIISFAWTTPALVAGHKTCTRRDWSGGWAWRFHAGDLVAAYDRSPRVGGRQVGVIRLTNGPYVQDLRLMPDSDYEAEGFAWMHEHLGALGAAGLSPRDVDRTAFNVWRLRGGRMWVVRFELVSAYCALLPDGRIAGDERGKAGARPAPWLKC